MGKWFFPCLVNQMLGAKTCQISFETFGCVAFPTNAMILELLINALDLLFFRLQCVANAGLLAGSVSEPDPHTPGISQNQYLTTSSL